MSDKKPMDRTKTITHQYPTFDLEKWTTMEEGMGDRKVGTLAMNVPYGMAKGLKLKAECSRHPFGTYFRIVPNKKVVVSS